MLRQHCLSYIKLLLKEGEYKRKMGRKPAIYICEPIHEKAYEYLEKRADILCREEEIADAWGVLTRNLKLDKKTLDKMPKLKRISVHGTGTDGVDMEEAARRGIVVTTTPGINARSVAELSAGLLLCLGRKIVCADRRLQAGAALQTADRTLQGMELYGKTLGLIGTGNIGLCLAEIMQGFGMKVMGLARDGKKKTEKIDWAESLEELLAGADVINVAVPLQKSTEKMLGEKEFSLMKQGALLINVSRGGVVDEKALFEALQTGKIAGAASDVFTQEPPRKKDNPLLGLDNFIGTPHIGANTEEALYRVGMKAVENLELESFLNIF